MFPLFKQVVSLNVLQQRFMLIVVVLLLSVLALLTVPNTLRVLIYSRRFYTADPVRRLFIITGVMCSPQFP